MKLLMVSLMAVGGSTLCEAQNKPSLDTDLLRSRIEQLEKTDPASRSAIVRDAYRRTLIRLYSEFDQALTQDINDLKKIQSISGADGNSKDDIGNQIQTLVKEQGANAEKLKTLQTDTAAAPAKVETGNPATSSDGRDGSAGDEGGGSPSTSVASPRTISSTPATGPQAGSAGPAGPPPICTDSNGYPDAPELVTQAVNEMAANIVERNDVRFFSQNYAQTFLYTVADAVIPEAENTDRSIKQLKAYRYLAETARTDKQIGASAKATGSTSAIEKPGFARILGMAVERGAILQNVSGSSLTLSTSPYALYTFNEGGDSQQNYERAGFLNRVGVSATFNIGDSNSAVLANARRSQLSEWSARVRLYGDRSTRSKSFARFWDEQIEPQIKARLVVISKNIGTIGNTAELKGLEDAKVKMLETFLLNRMAQSDYKNAVSAKDAAKQKSILSNAILCFMRQSVFEPIRNGTVKLSPEIRTQLGTNFIRDLGTALVGLEQARKRLNEKLDDLSKSPLATFAYTNHRVPTGSDYSEFKFLYEQDQTIFRALKLVGNVGFSLYNKPNPTLKQQKFRDFSASLSLEGKSNSPFLKSESDLSKVTYAFTGSYERMPENKGVTGKQVNLAAAQFKLEIPIVAGVSLPFSVTYANGTEQQKKNHTRGAFGLSFDLDKLMALTKLLQQR